MIAPVASFGENLVAAMARLGVSREQLAERIGRSLSQADKLRHASANPQLNTLFSLAKALRVTVESLCEGIDKDYDAMKRAASSSATQQRLTELGPLLNDAQRNVLIHMAEQLLRARADVQSDPDTPAPTLDPPPGLAPTVPPVPGTAADAPHPEAPEQPTQTPPTGTPTRA